MRIRLNTSLNRNPFVKRSKYLKRKQMDFQNEIKDIIRNILNENNNNRELVDKNISLLAEIDSLKKEKLDLFHKFMFRFNPSQIVIKEDLIQFIDSLKSDRKEVNEMLQSVNHLFNKMVDKINDKLEEVIKYEDNRIEYNNDLNEQNVSSEVNRLNCHQIREMRRNIRQNDLIQNQELSDISEPTLEVSEISNPLESVSTDNILQTPIRENNEIINYEMTPYSQLFVRTPSIFDFELLNIPNQQNDSFSTLDQSVRPNLTSFETLNSTLTEEQQLLMSSTPVIQMRSNVVETRPSLRLSSIKRPYSPRYPRSSLIDIQNVIEGTNSRKSGKHSYLPTNCETKPKESNGSKDINKRKKCETKSFDSEISGNSSNSSSVSLRKSRRNINPVSYKEKSLREKIRRTDCND